MTPRPRNRLARVSVIVLLLMLSVPAIRAATGRGAPPKRPNVILIVSDDQRWDTLWAMPAVRHRIADRGVTFSNGYVVNPACCPSRSSMLTGDYSHSTGVWRNHGRHGGFGAFDDASTIATWLHDDGYETGLFGKYLNGYAGTTYVPPGWDRWMAFDGQSGRRTGNYYDYDLNVDGTILQHGSEPADYGTDVVADGAVGFVNEADGPFFLVFTPPAPHFPALPAPRHADAVDELTSWRPPSFDEGDVADKPTWAAALPPLDADDRAGLDGLRRQQLQTLLALDEAVGRLVESLRQTDRLADTAIFYVSDNGYLLGEHRLLGKAAPYEESIRVPFLFRYDRLRDLPATVTEPVLNIDLAPTIAGLTSVATPDTDGRSLLPLLTGAGSWTRTAFLVEHLGPGGPLHAGTGIPTYCAIHTLEHVYVVYESGGRDLYDLAQDPDELDNLASGDAAPTRLEARLRTRLRSLCDPAPPGFDRLD